jgi:hypothetical protein
MWDSPLKIDQLATQVATVDLFTLARNGYKPTMVSLQNIAQMGGKKHRRA